jgi:hypothetical protein|tara:strand:+ start:11346 stop:11636 length:291 start_codon:yes stop_codon:yes gene_type:complete
MKRRNTKYLQDETECLPPDETRDSWLVRFPYGVKVDGEIFDCKVEVEFHDGESNITSITDEGYDLDIDVGELDDQAKQVREMMLEAEITAEEHGAF